MMETPPPTFEEDPAGATPLESSLGKSGVEEGPQEADKESQPLAGEWGPTTLAARYEQRLKDEEAESLRRKELEELANERQKVRLSQGGVVDGIPDWLLDASSLLDELYEALGQHSGGLQRLRAVIAEAAKWLDDEEWEQFRRSPFDEIHRQDYHVFARLLADAEPHWRRLMEDPPGARGFSNISRQTVVREYLYIGLTEPSEKMMDFFKSRGWSMDRAPPVLPKPLDKQAGEEDGPNGYQLVIVDLTFPCDTTQGESTAETEEKKEESNCDDAVEIIEGQGLGRCRDPERSSDDLVCDALQDFPEHTSGAQSPQAWGAPRLAGLPLKASGYGKIGVSRSNGVRRRLRIIQGALAEGLRNLQKGGVLVASWCGLPTHPVLPFLTKQLRPGFRRVHVLTPPDCQTFETYIVAAEFDRDGHVSRPDPIPLRPRESRNTLLELEPAQMCKFNFPNWLRSPLRSWSTGYDDVLAWTLNFKREIFQECLPKYQETVVNDARSGAAYDRPWLTHMPKSHVARSAPLDMEARFDEMWSIYATKLGLLMNRLEENSLDPDILPEKPPYRFNATTSWTVPRPALPPAEHVILPQRRVKVMESVLSAYAV
ncbi:tubd1 [Symbiodinium natans]|uniref:Tubd1 protein n=1 Tax=Symbiodinium natans TaxID=878477 RepID=A0A812QFZ8_9DINO|nr:tubd1 [Symbiodinium natans]